ncbi:hypothetical protein [Microbulbifer sp. VAAF005]|uniref:hypothetical protein n=1 Tax=Microbulbifer sp. VAAF005 TaxID=3034230 RepID=UPI0024AD431D|nr:hypothetical protein [Microbulbifer sp. VAAF005]WHI46566.1 hypothetical protein P0078_23145 [Microbulbifer sp. VAAF005]
MTYSIGMDKQKRIQKARAKSRLASHVRDYWYRKRKQLALLCAEAGEPCAASYLHQVASGRRKARPDLAKVIVQVSGDELTEQDGADYCYLQ